MIFTQLENDHYHTDAGGLSGDGIFSKKTMKKLIAIVGATALLALGSYAIPKKRPEELGVALGKTGIVDDAAISTALAAGSSPAGITEQQRRLNMYVDSLWTERSRGRAIIPYTLESDFDSRERHVIRNALDKLEERTGCLKFVPRTSERDYIYVTNLGSGCWSWIGSGGRRRMNFSSDRCIGTSTIQHKFMHALGFSHEHTRPDRDNYVIFNRDNVEDDSRLKDFDKATGTMTLGSPYDYKSIMSYSTDQGGKSVLLTKDRGEITPARGGITATDANKIKLLYQCERNGQGFVRNWKDLMNNPCTSDCKCRQNDTGCGTNDDACHGSLVCRSNSCVLPRNDYDFQTVISRWQDETHEKYCIDLYRRDTTNYNKVWYFPCNGTPAQKWYRDLNTNYIRSMIDLNKCLVGEGGRTERFTKLMIHDCLPNNDKYRWLRYTDGSIRPHNNRSLCIQQRSGRVEPQDLILGDCINGYKEWDLTVMSYFNRQLDEISNGSEMIDDEQLEIISDGSEIIDKPEFEPPSKLRRREM